MGIILAILAAAIAGIGKVVLKKSLADLNSSIGFFLESIFGLILWSSFAVYKSINLNEVWNILPIVILSAILSEAYIFYVYSKGNITVTGSAFASYPIFTSLFAFILIGEKLSSEEILFIIFTIFGIILLAIPYKKLEKLKNLKGILWGISGAIAVGISDSISKGSIDQTSASTFLFTLGFAQIPVGLVYLKIEKESFSQFPQFFVNFNKYRYSILSAFLISLSMIFFWLSFEYNTAAIASTITGSNIFFMVIFARIILDEKISRKDFISIIIILSGIAGLSFIG